MRCQREDIEGGVCAMESARARLGCGASDRFYEQRAASNFGHKHQCKLVSHLH